MYSVLNCIAFVHDLRLVLLAAVVCAAACVGAFGCYGRSRQASGAQVRWLWIGLTGLVAGSGVWATHFIGMLAYQPHLSIRYEPVLTAVSLAVAIGGMAFGFAIPVIARGPAAILGGGLIVGLTISAMHFLGIAAIRTEARIAWQYGYVAAAMIVGVIGATAALYARTYIDSRAGRLGAKLLLLLSIVGLHFTAMTAVVLIPDPSLFVQPEFASRDALAGATLVLAVLVLVAAGALTGMERLGRRATLSGVRDALNSVSAGLAFYDPAGRLLSWNRAFGDMIAGSGVALAVGVRREDLAEAVLSAGWQASLDISRQGLVRYYDQGRAPELDLQLPDGRWLRHESFATADGGGVSVMIDITEQQQIARALAEARDTAEAANRAKSQFLANMSHEIRTPLNGLLGVADVLSASGLSERQLELVGVIRTSGGLLNALLGDLLDLARVEAGAATLRPEPASLNDIAKSVRDLYAPEAERKGVGLHLDVGPGAGVAAVCDPVRLRQVLGNLISNAVKFTDAGEVTLALRRAGDLVTFEVRDTGIGFDAALKSRLFGRFQQADDSSTRRHGGAGLGLSISREYVALMGGALDGESRPGVGSVFGFTLDLPALSDTTPSPVALAGVAMHDGFRVLIVDDNAINRQVLGLILESAGIEHAAAENGQEGVDAARTGAFDAVLMDIQMPVMDGFEATRRIRAWEGATGRSRLPIYIVSANGLQEHVDAGVAAGADGHLNKPVSVPQLLGALEPHVNAALAA